MNIEQNSLSSIAKHARTACLNQYTQKYKNMRDL